MAQMEGKPGCVTAPSGPAVRQSLSTGSCQLSTKETTNARSIFMAFHARSTTYHHTLKLPSSLLLLLAFCLLHSGDWCTIGRRMREDSDCGGALSKKHGMGLSLHTSPMMASMLVPAGISVHTPLKTQKEGSCLNLTYITSFSSFYFYWTVPLFKTLDILHLQKSLSLLIRQPFFLWSNAAVV